MKMILVLGLLLVTVGGGHASGDDEPRILCGRRLANVHMFYCANTQDAIHKRVPGRLGSTYSDINALGLKRPWRYPQHALSLTSTSRAKRAPGLVDECCVKPCYISELLNYC